MQRDLRERERLTLVQYLFYMYVVIYTVQYNSVFIDIQSSIMYGITVHL